MLFPNFCSSIHFFVIPPAVVYEVPSNVYTGEQILKSPRQNKKKICHTKPINVSRSTFVVDLEHPDDIKKDDFGKWVYGGSHSVSYAAFQPGGFERASGRPTSRSDVFQLRCINCKHPLNSVSALAYRCCVGSNMVVT